MNRSFYKHLHGKRCAVMYNDAGTVTTISGLIDTRFPKNLYVHHDDLKWETTIPYGDICTIVECKESENGAQPGAQSSSSAPQSVASTPGPNKDLRTLERLSFVTGLFFVAIACTPSFHVNRLAILFAAFLCLQSFIRIRNKRDPYFFGTIKHSHVGSRCNELGCYWWGRKWGLGFTIGFHKLPSKGAFLRILAGKLHLCFHFKRLTESALGNSKSAFPKEVSDR